MRHVVERTSNRNRVLDALAPNNQLHRADLSVPILRQLVTGAGGGGGGGSRASGAGEQLSAHAATLIREMVRRATRARQPQLVHGGVGGGDDEVDDDDDDDDDEIEERIESAGAGGVLEDASATLRDSNKLWWSSEGFLSNSEGLQQTLVEF